MYVCFVGIIVCFVSLSSKLWYVHVLLHAIFLLSLVGFRGRSKPNLLRQETTSILSAFRILYHMLTDSNREQDYEQIEENLLRYTVLEYSIAIEIATAVGGQ